MLRTLLISGFIISTYGLKFEALSGPQRPIPQPSNEGLANIAGAEPEPGPPGPYSFGYNANWEDGSSSRQETSDGSKVTGQYSLTMPDGISRVVHYIADKDGFRASIATNEHGTESHSPSGVAFRSSQLPADELSRNYRGVIRPFVAHSYDVKADLKDEEEVKSSQHEKPKLSSRLGTKSIPLEQQKEEIRPAIKSVPIQEPIAPPPPPQIAALPEPPKQVEQQPSPSLPLLPPPPPPSKNEGKSYFHPIPVKLFPGRTTLPPPQPPPTTKEPAPIKLIRPSSSRKIPSKVFGQKLNLTPINWSSKDVQQKHEPIDDIDSQSDLQTEIY